MKCFRLSSRLRARRIRNVRLLRIMQLRFESIRHNLDLDDLSEDEIYELAYYFATACLKLSNLRARRARILLHIRSLKRKGKLSESEALTLEDSADMAYRKEVEYVLF